MAEKVIISGGSGFIGSAMAETLAQAGYNVVVLSRRSEGEEASITFDVWDGQTVGPWAQHLDGAAAVVNLAGESLADERWTAERKQALLDSRVKSTRTLMDALEQTPRRPEALIQASAIGFYGSGEDDIFTENSPGGTGFLAEVCRQWEQAAQPAQSLGVRLVIMRLGVVLGRDGGILKRLLTLFRRGLGGPWGSGRQWLSWVHLADVISAVEYFLHTPTAQGVYNLTSPQPVQVREFARCLGAALHRPAIMKAPAAILRLALGEMADEMLLSGQRVEPRKLLQEGFSFRFSDLKNALKDIVS
ncbi:MAG: TIGR01777 family oxidoreductase [Sedimentisphaerales bacterium]|nr:TIGR01777 family oxidoreductase [Sedimentisphaerales bacterium]